MGKASTLARYTFFTQAARDGSNVAASSEELVNCFAEQAPGDARTKLAIRAVPGEVQFANYGQSLVRAAALASGKLYVIAANTLYSITSAGTVTSIGAVGDSEQTTISGNGTKVAVASAGVYYVWDGASLTTPVGGAVTNVGSVCFSDFDTIITELNGKKYEWTAVANPETRNGTYFASAEARDGNIIRGEVDQAQLYLFCENHIEIVRNTGIAGSGRYRRLTVIDQGLKAYNLMARARTGIFFIGVDDTAYLLSGNSMSPVSTPAVQTDIMNSNPTACYYYEFRGHKFCVIRFANAPAWVYDITTQLWHRRQTGVARGPWGLQRMVRAFGEYYGFDDTGNVVVMSDVQTDRDATLARVMRGKPLDLEGQRFSVSEWEFMCGTGTVDAQVMFRWSWDGGQTWVGPKVSTLGPVGAYGRQALFNGMGRGDQFTPEFTVTDNADITFYSDSRVRLT